MSVRRTTVLALPALMLLPRIAGAGEPAAAEQLYDEAKQLTASGHYAEACPKFEQSQKLDPGLGTQFHLADCWQHVGRTASAWALFREVASGARASGQMARERVAKDRADALEPFLSKLAIVPGNASTIAGLVIQRDGTEVPREAWGSPVPVDPGKHEVIVSAPAKQAWQSGVDVEGQGKVVTIEVPLLANVATAQAPAPVPAAVSAAQPTPVPSPPPPSTAHRDVGVTSAMPTSEQPVLQNRGGAQRAVGWILVGAGLVGVGVGAYFGARWMGDHETASLHCPGGACDSIGIASNDDADKQARYVVASAGGGLASLIIGTVLVATAPSPRLVPANTARLEVTPIVGRGASGLALTASW
jgi:serine/threonine-protein kinase